MLESDFLRQLNRLNATFGDKPFSVERMAMIKSYSRNCTASQFERVVNKIIATHRQAPLPKDFLDIIKDIQKTDNALGDYSVYRPCDHCDGDGYVSAIKVFEEREYSYAFRCPVDCAAARHNCAPNVPIWNPDRYKEYSKRKDHSMNDERPIKKPNARELISRLCELKNITTDPEL